MESPVLLLIDVQREYFDLNGPLHIPDGPAVLDRLADLLGTARASGVPVVHVRHEEPSGTGVFEPGSHNAEIMDAVAPLAGEPVILKHFPGAYDGTDLEDVLDEVGAQTLIIGGFMTHMCCDTTARQAAARGLDVIMLADGTGTRDLVSPNGDLLPYQQVQETTLAVQKDGFSTIRYVADLAQDLM